MKLLERPTVFLQKLLDQSYIAYNAYKVIIKFLSAIILNQKLN